MRPKNASDIAISDSRSIFRGVRSPIQHLENALAGASFFAPEKSGSPSTKRMSYWLGQEALILGKGRIWSNGVACGISTGWCDHDGRRSAKTAVASVVVSPPCISSTHQCCDDRLALTRRTSRSKSPCAIGAQKLTVTDNGSPDRCGWSI